MCEWGKTKIVRVKIPADLSSTGKEKWKDEGIDECIAPIVEALQRGGIDMRGSCCGHRKDPGDIHLQDGRVLVIVNGHDYYRHRSKLYLTLFLKSVWNKINFWIRSMKIKFPNSA